MLIRQTRLYLFFVLALLQCLAPLIHGHLLGASGEGVHIHALGVGKVIDSHAAGTVVRAADDETVAIGVATEYKRDVILLPSLAGLIVLLLILSGFQRPVLRPPLPCRRLADFPHFHPLATAPPVLAA